MPGRLPPAEKLPLAVRKNVRDEWDAAKEGLAKSISDLLGETWTIDINPAAIYPYAEEGSYGHHSLGACIKAYVAGVEYQLKYFLSRNGDGVKNDINTIAHAHVLTMDFDENKTVSYSGPKVTPEGQLVILFTEGNLGTNVDYAFEEAKLTKALDEADQAGLPMNFSARKGIAVDYEPKIAEVTEKFNKILGTEGIVIIPRFEENYEILKAGGPDVRDDYPTNLGSFVLKYLEGVNWYLTGQKVPEDDMLQEGIVEAIEKKEVHFRVGEIKKSYNEVVFEDGILYIQTNPKNFGTNIDYAAEGIIDLL